jgi:3-hydroxyisobutyrate dehydrogenase-like beta-hydroxyacid dehydrogenase
MIEGFIGVSQMGLHMARNLAQKDGTPVVQ